MSSAKVPRPATATLEKKFPNPVIVNSHGKNTTLTKVKEVTSKFTNLLSPSLSHALDGRIYKHFCHTCNVHFRTIKNFEAHILQSPAHQPFELTMDIAEKNGYLNIPNDSSTKSYSPGDLRKAKPAHQFTKFVTHRYRRLGPDGTKSCQKTGCSCPLFESTLSQPIASTSTTELRLFDTLDGAAGSTLHGHGGDEEEDMTFTFKNPIPPITPKSEGDQVPKSSAQRTARSRAEQDQYESRKRLNKRKNRNSEKRRKQAEAQHGYSIPKRVIDAYIANDEKLFGQRRFEEIDDENDKKAQKEALASWQQEVGMVENYQELADLEEDIDNLFLDVWHDLAMEAEEEKRNKASSRYKDRLFFEDTLEDVAIDHEFGLADQDQEKRRKAAEKKQNRELQNMNTEDIVDDIAMDHNQVVGEREEEHHRKKSGRDQNQDLNTIRMGDLVDDLAMDHIQEVDEKEQEYGRKVGERSQNVKLTKVMMLNHVDDFAMNHLQEVGEKAQERHRKALGMKQTKDITHGREFDLVDSLVMNHEQEVGEKAHENHRKMLGMRQTKKIRLADGKEEDLIDTLVMDHEQEVGEKAQEHHRKMLGTRQPKKLNLVDGKEADIVEGIVMDHMHETGEKKQEHYGNTSRSKQFKNLNRIAGNLTESLLPEDMQDPEDEKGGHQKRMLEQEQNTPKSDQSWQRVAKGKLNNFLDRYLPEDKPIGMAGKKDNRVIWRKQLDKGSQEILTIKKESPDQLNIVKTNRNPFVNHEIPGSHNGTLITSPEFGVADEDEVAPVPKKTRRQLRDEANAKFEAMLEQIVEAEA